MAAKGQAPEEQTTQYLVECDCCEFERTADGREEAARIGTDHREETGHDIVAVEVPPTVASS